MKDPDMVTTAFMLVRVAGLVSLWMLAQKDFRGWRLGIVAQVGFVAWAFYTGSLALIPLSAITIALMIYGLWEWSKPETRPYVVQLESELEAAVLKYEDLLDRYEAQAERNGRQRHDRATYTRRLSTYAHHVRDLAEAAGIECPPMPEAPQESNDPV